MPTPDYPDFVSSTGYGTVTGLCGVNCYHDFYPFIPGISEPIYSEEELRQMNEQENTPKEFGGKSYTAYEATQRQRALETTMRAQRQKISLLEQGGADEQDIINARGQYRATSAEYSRFSQAMGLPQQRERVTVDGLGDVGRGKTKGAEPVPQIRPTRIGSTRADTVTDQERAELLTRPPNRDIIKLSINMFDRTDPIFFDALSIEEEPRFEDMHLHGSPSSVQITRNGKKINLDVDEFVDEMKKRGYKGGDIRLCSCSTGFGDNSFAQQLSKKLGIKVKAPDSDLYYIPEDGVMFVGSEYRDTGKWRIFDKGVEISD